MTETDPNCIFCKIVAGEIPSFKLYEDARTFAFMDINPFNPGHCLAIPKAHFADLFTIPPEVIAATARTAASLARAVDRVLRPDGLNLIQANREAAGQTVFHFHFHVFPRRSGDEARLEWGHKPGDMDEIRRLAERITAEIGA